MFSTFASISSTLSPLVARYFLGLIVAILRDFSILPRTISSLLSNSSFSTASYSNYFSRFIVVSLISCIFTSKLYSYWSFSLFSCVSLAIAFLSVLRSEASPLLSSWRLLSSSSWRFSISMAFYSYCVCFSRFSWYFAVILRTFSISAWSYCILLFRSSFSRLKTSISVVSISLIMIEETVVLSGVKPWVSIRFWLS